MNKKEEFISDFDALLEKYDLNVVGWDTRKTSTGVIAVCYDTRTEFVCDDFEITLNDLLNS